MATLSLTLTTTFQSLGAGPMLVSLEVGGRAELYIGTSLPSPGAPIHSLLSGSDRSWLNYVGTDTVYAAKSAGTVGDIKISYTT